ncbi:MAG: nitrate reductase catalytic subunit [Cycloclasticus sp. symbiont of Poecilosclerida sp. N]|nr:MAG: nitrate reductase catalytic subunit [Cycloclasticus sp. symbiont of Poecilosclerida sp. N]
MLFGRKQKNPIKIADKKIVDWTYTTCGYCSTGCAIEVGKNEQGDVVGTQGVGNADVNRGKLCVKGIFEHELFDSPGRGKTPLLRKQTSENFREANWDETLDHTADEIKRIQKKYGRDAFAVVSTGQIFTEEFYTLGKVVRGLLGTNNYDGNTTLCMASAVSGYKRSFGSDGPPGCYEDFEHTDCLMAWGSNLPEQHPIIYWRMKEAKEKRDFPLIVIDPRVTMLAQFADIHLAIVPGTDVVLMNSLLHVIFAEGLEDKAYIKANTVGIKALKEEVANCDPATAYKICGIDEDTIRNVARLYAKAGVAMNIWTMGINQSTHGSDGVVGLNNLSLVSGNVGKPGGTSLSITGQCNAMGTREWSSCSGLPGYRTLENPEHREEIGKFWNVDPEFFPKKRGLAQTDIFPAIETGQVKGLWLIATNPMTSMANTPRIRKMLDKLEFLVVQDAYEDMECVEYAHAFLPAAVWAEKEGVMTNTERRVNMVRQVVPPYKQSKSDFDIFKELGKRFNADNKVKFSDTVAETFDEMRELSKGRLLDMSGMTHELIEEKRGIQWPYTEEQASKDEAPPTGGKRLYTKNATFSFPDGKARLIALPFIDNNERPDNAFPFWLNSGRLVEHFHTRTRTGKVGNNNKYSPIPFMEINPDAARQLGIEHQSYVRCVSRRGDAIVMAMLTQRIAKDAIFIPFHFYDCVNRLTLGLLDPHSRQPAFKQAAVRIEKLEDQEAAAQMNKEMRTY